MLLIQPEIYAFGVCSFKQQHAFILLLDCVGGGYIEWGKVGDSPN